MKKELFILLFTVILCGCWDYRRDLGNGYQYIRANADNHAIILSKGEHIHDIIVFSDIKKYAFNDNFIIGYKEQQDNANEYEPEFAQKNGFFIINKNTGELWHGLNNDDFEPLTMELKITNLIDEMSVGFYR